MRTTLDIDDRLHAIARRRAFEQRRSLGDVISELALRGLELEAPVPKARALGPFEGMIHIAGDFDETPSEVLHAIENPVE